ncbi:MAG: (2Fe-2S)-binding protein [Tepidanaerobacteraceae bacterium]|jgi:carbon-monoxide dehydrogenase small subunit|nr:(2Fe-2S)-binding protein [Tepidanaerobacteraceae bacterium]
MQELNLKVNGATYSVSVKADMTLLEVLRDKLHITSPKVGCNTGDCGACSVILDGQLVKSCITNALMADGKEVVTLEGLSKPGKLHPIQEAFHQYGASQCGFCTPGMIMASKALLDQNPNPTDEEIREALSGNLCRCTGYVNIIKAVKEAAKKMNGGE